LQYEALRRVHLIPSDDTPESSEVSLNANVFKDLDSTVSEGGENFSTGSDLSIFVLHKPLTFKQREATLVHGPRNPKT